LYFANPPPEIGLSIGIIQTAAPNEAKPGLRKYTGQGAPSSFPQWRWPVQPAKDA
jgi:hypothetical protein